MIAKRAWGAHSTVRILHISGRVPPEMRINFVRDIIHPQDTASKFTNYSGNCYQKQMNPGSAIQPGGTIA